MLSSAGRQLVRIGSPYAVDPGTVLKGDGEPFRVFTPFYRTWRAGAHTHPVTAPPGIVWFQGLRSDGIPNEPEVPAQLPPAGE